MKFLLISLFFVSTTSILAQPVLTQDDFNPQIGQEFELHNADYMDYGPTGAGVIWDFSGLTPNMTFSGNYISPENLPNPELYPDATHALDNSTGVNLVFNNHSDGLEVLGFDSDFFTIVYDDTEEYLSFPLSFGESGLDSFEGSWNMGFDVSRTGSIEYEYDSYGTLIMPFGTFENVVRLKQVESYTDVSQIQTINFTCDCYVWIVPGMGRPILEVYIANTDGVIEQGIQYSSAAPVSIAEGTIGEINIYPNPGRDILRIDGDFSDQAEFQFLDPSGRLIYEDQLTNKEIECTNMERGAYLLRLIDGDASLVRRILLN